jgi:hypothetical protein
MSFFRLYFLYDLLTAPGVMAHELSHAIFCVFAGVKIHKIKLFQFGKVAGYVAHDEPTKFSQGFLISAGPLIINSLVALYFFARVDFTELNLFFLLYLYLGAALALHAIPSSGDARALFNLANRRVFKNPFVLVGYPFVLLLYIFDMLKKAHLDWIYTVVLFWLGYFYLKT